jgi:hypothetical protein
MQSKVYVSYSPEQPGSVFALFYCESGTDVHGWHLETRGPYFSAAFFMVEDFYSGHPPHLYRSMEDDVYGPWMMDCPPTRNEIRCPVPDSVVHELERMQSRFVEEWLFFRDDPHIDAEINAFRELGLPVHEVNLKARRLHRLPGTDGTWKYMAPGTDVNVVQLVRKYWRLCEKIPSP